MPLLSRPCPRRRAVPALLAAVVVAGLASAPGTALAGSTDTVVGELVQGYGDPGPVAAGATAPADEGTGLLSWVQPGDGDAVRVPTEDVTALDPGSTVEVTVGAAVRDEASADGLEPARDVLAAEVVTPAEPAPTSPAVGVVDHRVTVVMMQPAGTAAERAADPTTLQQVVDAVNGPVRDFWEQQTRGAVRFGVVAQYDWATTTATCSQPFDLWQAAADRAHWQPGDREHLLVYIPYGSPGCAYGLGTVGNSLDDGGLAYVEGSGTAVIAHEFGHNLGLGHASELQCAGAVDHGSCGVSGYNDWYDVMGFSWERVGTLNAPHAALLGVLPADQVTTVPAWSPAATYSLVPISAASGLRAIELTSPDGDRLWLEYRQASGRDAWLATPNRGLQSGVTLRQSAEGGDTSLLLDATPGNPARSSDLQVVLPVGTPVPVWSGEVTVTVQSVAAGAAVVAVAPGGSPIGQRYVASGGPAGPLGAVTGRQVCGLLSGGCFRPFANGAVYWSPGTGAHLVSGAVRDRWASTGWEFGSLGYPVTDTICGLVRGGCYQHFQRGTVMSGPAGAWAISGALRDGWFASGSELGALGYPAGAQVCGLRGGGCFQLFEFGSLYWSPASGAHAVFEPVAVGWAQQGWERGQLGYPVSEMGCGLSGGGCYQHFQGGTVMWSGATGSWGIPVGVREGWFRLGSERSALGYPTASAVCGLRGGGCLQRFQAGSLYWSPATGSRAVRGAVGDSWGARGWERGFLGYPVSDTVCGVPRDGCYQHFEGGSLVSVGAMPVRAVSGVVRDVWFASGSEQGLLGYPTGEQVCGLRDGGCFQPFEGSPVGGDSPRAEWGGASVYSSPATGAHPVRGRILSFYAASGWEQGRFGYPIEDPLPTREGWSQRFQGGTIHYISATDGYRVS